MQTLTSIVALNIKQGGGTRTAWLIEWLRIENADIVVLSEWSKNSRASAAIEVALGSSGYHVRSQDGVISNGVLIAAKEPFDAVVVSPPNAQIGVLLKAKWKGGLIVIGAYFPQAVRAKRQFFQECTEQARQHTDAPFLLAGDLNTGRNDGDLTDGATHFPCAADFVALTTTGLIDEWRLNHPLPERQYTWRSLRNGFRIDHALGNTAFRTRYVPVSCNYDHSTRESKLSDHSALRLRLRSSNGYRTEAAKISSC